MPNSKSSHLDPLKILDHVRPTPLKDNGLTDEQKIAKIAGNFREIMETLGLDLTNDSLQESPNRVAKMYVQEYFRGLRPENFPRITLIENEMLYDQMVVVKDIKVLSCCEHHFVTIHGVAHVAYIPSHGVVGLSKINRIADYFSRRPQVQERLTKQIADCLAYILKTEDVAVFIKAKHYCVISRGVEDINSETITSDLRGAFKNNPETRAEFLQFCR
ncbi:MAG: GTP cyclohydrolase I FolE [Bdellovibrionota bacterium]